MTEERSHKAAPKVSSSTKISRQPQQRQTKRNSRPESKVCTRADIHAFENGISKIKDWTSKTVVAKHVQVIYWFDVEHLSREECIKRYPNKHGKPCSMTNIFKVYNTHAPRFYAEKGLGYIPLGKRSRARALTIKKKNKKKKKGKSVKKVKRNQLDVRLEELFATLPDHASPPPELQEDVGISPCAHHRTQVFDTADKDTITLLCKMGSTTYGDPSGIQLPRASLLRYCSTISAFLLENPHIHTITHGPEISADTISRFIACITAPPQQPRLPDFITTAYGTFEQEWSMSELEDLYVLGVTLGAGSVCDLVIDQLVDDLRRPEPRTVVDDFGEARSFDALDFGPELLNFLWLIDKKGFTFFGNLLLSHGPRGYAKMTSTHLSNWHADVKQSLIETIENSNVIDLFFTPPSTLCTTFHHHNHPPTDFPTTPPKPHSTPASARPAQTRPKPTLHLSIPRSPLTHRTHPQPLLGTVTDDPIYQRAAYGLDRLRAHKTAHMDERLRYRGKVFNAHHDTGEVCRVKMAMCREKVGMFAGRGEEVEVSVTAQEEGGEDEDEDEEMEEDESEEE